MPQKNIEGQDATKFRIDYLQPRKPPLTRHISIPRKWRKARHTTVVSIERAQMITDPTLKSPQQKTPVKRAFGIPNVSSYAQATIHVTAFYFHHHLCARGTARPGRARQPFHSDDAKSCCYVCTLLPYSYANERFDVSGKGFSARKQRLPASILRQPNLSTVTRQASYSRMRLEHLELT